MSLFRRRRPTFAFAFDEPPTTETIPCDCCDAMNVQSMALVNRDGAPFARYWLVWYPESNEAWLDATLGLIGESEDRVTFGCRIGAIDGQEAPACSLVPAAELRADDPLFGTKLSPLQARDHAWVSDFWALTDWLFLNDELAHDNLYHFSVG